MLILQYDNLRSPCLCFLDDSVIPHQILSVGISIYDSSNGACGSSMVVRKSDGHRLNVGQFNASRSVHVSCASSRLSLHGHFICCPFAFPVFPGVGLDGIWAFLVFVRGSRISVVPLELQPISLVRRLSCLDQNRLVSVLPGLPGSDRDRVGGERLRLLLLPQRA